MGTRGPRLSTPAPVFYQGFRRDVDLQSGSTIDARSPLITSWHLCIGGFRQHEGELTGLHRLWLKLRALASPSTVVTLREWDADWAELAELIWLSSINGQGPTINVYAYSWGAGYGFVELAKALRARGLWVHAACLCDPVYRSRLLVMRWLALIPNMEIVVPSNVQSVHWTRQRVGRPMGHDLVAESRNTYIAQPVICECDHRHMDEHPAFHRLALEAAGLSIAGRAA